MFSAESAVNAAVVDNNKRTYQKMDPMTRPWMIDWFVKGITKLSLSRMWSLKARPLQAATCRMVDSW